MVIHEMLHNLGVGHEQNRPDRDSLMSIDWTNIPVDKVISFSSGSVEDVGDLGNLLTKSVKKRDNVIILLCTK